VEDIYDDILEQEGFHKIGALGYRIELGVWWHPDAKIQVTRLPLGSKSLLKGNKAYFMKSITEQGETWARDIGPLQNYLEAHFPELHISFSYFRDITPTLAATQIRRKLSAETPSIDVPSVEDIARLQRKLSEKRLHLQSSDDLLGLDTGTSDLLQSYTRRQVKTFRREIQHLEQQAGREKERLSLFNHLQKEYERKGSAACFVFSLSSNTHMIDSPPEFRDALRSIVKELTDAHRYQVTQKLCGGRLNIHVAEAAEPALVWLEEWFGGALSPRQMTRLEGEFQLLRKAAEEHTMITPNEDIRVDGSVKDDQKLLAARVVSTQVRRLDRPQAGMNLKDMTKDSMPATVGLIITNGRATTTSFHLPLARSDNAYVSGATGSGKSYLGRVIVEEAVQYDDLSILVLDSRNQAAGLLVSEDRESVLSLYPEFGMRTKSARGFDFKYYAPAQTFGEKIPSDMSKLGRGRSIVSFKSLDDRNRCMLFRQILDAVFKGYAGEESASVRLLIVIEEAQRFTKKRVSEDAKAAGEQAENALDRTVREGRKYGCCTFILSQTIRDFSYDSASIRQNTNTKIFLHNSDREVDYAANFIGDGRRIIQLTPGTAMIYNSAWGAVQVKVRPPLSKVWEFSAEDTRKLVTQGGTPLAVLSPDAKRLLVAVGQYYSETGHGLNLSQASDRLGISSKRQLQQMVDELERKCFVRSRKLRQQGQPRIIEPISSGGAD